MVTSILNACLGRRVPLRADDKPSIKSEELKELDGQLGGALSDIVALHEFKGKAVGCAAACPCMLAACAACAAEAGAVVQQLITCLLHAPCGLQGSSQTVRCGGQARFVTLYGLGPADKVKVASDWGASPFQTFGATIASAAKANKAKTVGAALVGSTLSGAPRAAVDGPPPHTHTHLLLCPGHRTSARAMCCAEADAAAAAGKAANGIVNGAYEATRFKAKPNHSTLESGGWRWRGGCPPVSAVPPCPPLRHVHSRCGPLADAR